MADIDNLRAFALAVLEDWPEGAPDGFDLQDLGIKHGLLALKDPQPTEPCGEHCWCADYHGSDQFAGGVECYIRTPLLLGTAAGVKACPEGACFVDAEGRFYDDKAEPIAAGVGVSCDFPSCAVHPCTRPCVRNAGVAVTNAGQSVTVEPVTNAGKPISNTGVQPSQAQSSDAQAWQHEEDPTRVISAAQKAQALRDGGASASSVKSYRISLTRGVGGSNNG